MFLFRDGLLTLIYIDSLINLERPCSYLWSTLNNRPWHQLHTPPSLWKRYVDDTFVILETKYKEEFFHHINTVDSHIKFTVENTREDGSIPFLDSLITPNQDGSLQTKVYRKPTHTNQYLKWDSHHAILNKYSVISSLLHRAKQRDRMCNWVLDLKDQKYDVQKEIWKLEQDLNGKKEELAQLEARKKELEASGLKGPIVTPSVSGFQLLLGG